MNVAEAILYAMCGAMAMICIYLYTKMQND